jgi:hypothetical protein
VLSLEWSEVWTSDRENITGGVDYIRFSGSPLDKEREIADKGKTMHTVDDITRRADTQAIPVGV